MIFRPLQEHEFEAWVKLCEIGFQFQTPADHFRQHFLNDPWRQFSSIFVAEDDGKLVASLRIFFRTMYFYEQEVPFIGIGEVCTLPEYKGQGISTHLMNMAMNHYAKAPASFAYLGTGIPGFYERYGFKMSYFQWHQIKTTHLKKVLDAPYKVQTPTLKEMQVIYQAFSKHHIGAIVRDEMYVQQWVGREVKHLIGLYKNNTCIAYVDYEKKEEDYFIRECGEIETGAIDILCQSLNLDKNCIFHLPAFLPTNLPVVSMKQTKGRMMKLTTPFSFQGKKIESTEALLEVCEENYIYWKTDYC